MSDTTSTRKVYVDGKVQTVILKPRAVAAQRLSRDEKAAAREESRRKESVELNVGPKPEHGTAVTK